MQTVPAETIQAWLTTQLSTHLGCAPADIDVRKPFTEYGLDSMVGVFLAGDLEAWLGLQLSPTVLWDYPTTEALAQFVATERWRQGAAVEHPAQTPALSLDDVALDPEAAEVLLSRLDTLSEAEVDQLLSDLLATKALAA